MTFTLTKNNSRRLAVTLVAGLSFLAPACAADQKTEATQKTETLTVQTGKIANSFVDRTPGKESLDDVVIGSTPLVREGAPFGYMHTVSFNVDLPDDGVGVEGWIDRMGWSSYRFNDNDSIETLGEQRFPSGHMVDEVGKTFNRVIAGGTGAYLGARGEAALSKNADGTWTITFTLLK